MIPHVNDDQQGSLRGKWCPADGTWVSCVQTTEETNWTREHRGSLRSLGSASYIHRNDGKSHFVLLYYSWSFVVYPFITDFVWPSKLKVIGERHIKWSHHYCDIVCRLIYKQGKNFIRKTNNMSFQSSPGAFIWIVKVSNKGNVSEFLLGCKLASPER